MSLVKSALVTGANRGIGKEISKQLLRLGFFVVMTGRDIKKVNAAQNEIDPEKLNSISFQIDVSDLDEIKKTVDEITAVIDHLDVLINNAGIIGSTNGITNLDEVEFQKVIASNSFGPLFMIKTFLPLLKKSRDARVINISSAMGAQSDLTGNYAAYRLSKSFLNSITILAASEFQSAGIKVNSMHPGWVKTDMGGSGASRSIEKGAETAIWLATEKNIPTGKFFQDKKEISF